MNILWLVIVAGMFVSPLIALTGYVITRRREYVVEQVYEAPNGTQYRMGGSGVEVRDGMYGNWRPSSYTLFEFDEDVQSFYLIRVGNSEY